MNERLIRAGFSQEADRIGIFGKLPTHGDFVSTTLERRLQLQLDQWIQKGLEAMEPQLGKDWRRLFHAFRPWRFAVAADVWGPAAVAGVLLPSRDRVGRSFPLIIAAQLHKFGGGLRDICEDDSWFAAAEALAETSAKPDFDMSRFVESVRRLRLPRPSDRSQETASAKTGVPASLWWRMAPGARHGSGFKTEGAPTVRDFLKLVTAEEAGLAPLSAPATPRTSAPTVAPAEDAVVPQTKAGLESSYASHPGTRLSLNADALLINERPRLFALADGTGDGLSAIEAAKLVTNVLAGVGEHDEFQTLIQDIKGKLGHANSILQTKGGFGERESPCASVVVATISHEELALVWAGDARCYLLRDGMMRCLTQDHVNIGLRRTPARGVGLKQQFIPETLFATVQGGDRLILCSAPLSRTLTDRVIAEIIIETPVEKMAETLIQEALIANCRENLSVIVVGIA